MNALRGLLFVLIMFSVGMLWLYLVTMFVIGRDPYYGIAALILMLFVHTARN
jgi:hypothetical protein